MTAQSGLGFSGIVAIQIPDDGAVGTVLTKITADNYDYDWLPGGGGGGGQVNTVVGGININVNAADPINPIVNLDAAITGVSVNGVTLNAAGLATNFLNEAGAYIAVPPGGGQVDSVVGGTNISVNAGDPINPIVNLDAAITGVSVNAVTLTAAGVATNYLDETGAYSVPTGNAAALDHNLLLNLPVGDVHTQYLFLAGRAGGQSAFGGTLAGQTLALQGSANADRGRILANGGMTIDWDWTTDAVTAGGFFFNNTIPASGGIITSMITINNTIGVTGATFIISALDDLSTLTWSVVPGFAVSTLFFARPTYQSASVGVPPAQAFIYAAQAQFRVTGTGAVTVPTYRALSFAPIVRVDQAGDDISFTNVVGITVGPLYNTRNATATADYGTIRGVHMLNASVIFFGAQIGSEIAANWIGVDMEALTGLTVSGVRAAVRSAIPSAAGNFVIQNIGGAESDFGNGDIHLDDNTQVKFGNTVAVPDAAMYWDGSNLIIDPQDAGPSAARVEVPNGGIMVTGAAFPVSDFIRTAPSTNLVLSAWRLTGQSSGDMADGFGTALFWTIEDDAAVKNNIAYWSAERAGADNTGLIRHFVYEAGVANQIFEASGNTFTVTSRARVQGANALVPISPAQITTDVDDYQGQGSGNAMRGLLRLSTDASRTMTGIDATTADFSEANDELRLVNIGSFDLVLGHQDVGSVATNRIISPTGVDLILGPDESALLWYDGTTARWRILETTGA